jgi:hypothetical protein
MERSIAMQFDLRYLELASVVQLIGRETRD